MKRRWSDEEDSSSTSSSSSSAAAIDDTESEHDDDGHHRSHNNNKQRKITTPSNSNPSSKLKKPSQVESGKQKRRAIDFEALNRHGYKGGLSVLRVPPPKEPLEHDQNWSWSTGQESHSKEKEEETYEERQRTRAAIIEGEQLMGVQNQKDKKNISFSQKEKKKRDLGQASRGKNYVEEEKRLLRENGIYSGFDS